MKKLVTIFLITIITQLGFAQDSVDVTFYYYPMNNPNDVHVPGEFNGWNPSSAASQMINNASENTWSKTIRLRVGGPNPLPAPNSVPGAYQYKFHDGDWFSDPLNPRQNSSDNNNTFLPINDPTIHLLLPNSTPTVTVVRTRFPEISAYLFPSTATELDTSTIALSIGAVTYTNIGSAYDSITHRFSLIVPDALGDGEHSLVISAATLNGDSHSDTTSFSVQADEVQFLTLPAQTWKDSWHIMGAIYDIDGGMNADVHSAELSRAGEIWNVSVVDGIIDTTIDLIDDENNFQIQAIIDGSQESSTILPILKRVDHEPVATLDISDTGAMLILNGANSQDPDGGVLTYQWSGDARNPESLGLQGLTANQEIITRPTTPGEYYVSLRVEDEAGEADSTQGYFFVEQDGESINVGHFEDNPQWVKNSRIYLLFFKAFTPEGTIASAIPNLDYIAAMGFNTIWVLPVMEIPGDVDNQINIGYYIEDFMHVESSYGTDQDYKDFVSAAHDLDLKVIQDVTPNHSGDVHPFAEEAATYGEASQYWHYYQSEYIPHNANGLGDCFTPEGIYYYCGFSERLLNWDWRDLDARRYMTGVYEYWMEEFGIDGYRYDVYWGPNRKYGETNMGVPVREALKHIKPDILLLGEDDGTGAGTESIYSDQGGGLDAAYDFKTYFNAIRNFSFSSSSVNTLHNELNNGGYYPGENSYYLRFMESQDEDRISYKYNSFVKTMPMASVILTAPGIPMISNGQEVGWGKGMGAPGEPDLNDRRRGVIDWEFEGRDLLTPHYQKLAQIRAQFPAFWQHKQDTNYDGNVDDSDESDFDRVGTGNGILYAFLRPYTNSNGLTVVNFSSQAQSGTLDLSAQNLKFTNGFSLDSTYWVNNHYTGINVELTGLELQNFTISLADYGTAIITISDNQEMVEIPSLPDIVSVDDQELVQADDFRLHQNYPNPFNPVTTIRYYLANPSELELNIYDINGRLVTNLVSSAQSAGYHEITWEGQSSTGLTVETGLYLAQIRAGEFSDVIKMIYLK
ncbi:MAG: T9SS type A sorting domain-containing protein [Candidatus Marinimicrobia bacterium]|jgi:glycosidase|nr:T9SS type A sorting domain-containing protein [Candidatus Neomarinimicrobiota bacterium]MBT3632527.1 T9SS type A sorting domain-containing protein [Candidatus Neomarinimicrobiota bacterium]MBT3824926.1 T9SS type A sorting domain-containing protein [Candidatus Neomarinimicrobiota bacterium]MBT4132795.1 T9SS type A sorting domain-containing protein [Candidatus Neomarinimicrobiota bacterium]MBT4295283.1 T9SS type A sorting domain-containing protein [Candidatus Neomarinimicrobiota bacterium]